MKETDMKIYFYQAECGDAARISYLGDDGQHHNILIDSGYERTFRHILSDQITEITKQGEAIDLWIISHIHDDHIGGVIRYIAAIKTGEFKDIVKEWYYNSPRPKQSIDSLESNPVSEVKSIDQGDVLLNYLKQNNKLSDVDIVSGISSVEMHGMEILVLSPSVQKLQALRTKYSSPNVPLQKIEAQTISEAAGAKGYDYNTKIEDFDLDHWSEDGSVENGSSISLLTTIHGKNVLWLADSHPSDVISSLRRLGYSENHKIKCDWVKVTHHGSKGNNSNELYSLIDCENYLMSVNGENKHYLPTKESMVRIIRNKNRKDSSMYSFFFTYDNEVLRDIFAIDGEDVFNRWKFKVDYLSEKKYLEFDL